VRAAEIWQPRDRHTRVADRLLKRCEMDAGSPVASCARVGSGSPSVCETSYLGIRQPRYGEAALAAEGDTFMARI
jgi:hypothetical protein